MAEINITALPRESTPSQGDINDYVLVPNINGSVVSYLLRKTRALIGRFFAKDEGLAIGDANTLNFVGAGVSTAIAGDELTITINGSSLSNAQIMAAVQGGLIAGSNIVLTSGPGTLTIDANTASASDAYAKQLAFFLS